MLSRGSKVWTAGIKTKRHMRSLSDQRLKYFPSQTTRRTFFSTLSAACDYLKYIRCNNTSLFAHRTNTETAFEWGQDYSPRETPTDCRAAYHRQITSNCTRPELRMFPKISLWFQRRKNGRYGRGSRGSYLLTAGSSLNCTHAGVTLPTPLLDFNMVECFNCWEINLFLFFL